jgi:hypothetical protein
MWRIESVPLSSRRYHAVPLVFEGQGCMSLSKCSRLSPPAAQTVRESVSTMHLHEMNHNGPGILP